MSLFGILLWLSSVLGLYVNTSNSLTPGIYLRSDLADFIINTNKFFNKQISNYSGINTKNINQLNLNVQTKLTKGDVVAFCPPNISIFQIAKQRNYIDAGSCKGSLGIMLKQIVALNGDVITINQNGVWINGELLKFSKPLTVDALNRKMPQINLENYHLKNNEVLVMTNINPYSFDSRYFGVIDTK